MKIERRNLARDNIGLDFLMMMRRRWLKCATFLRNMGAI
jgi:hypothetical protein